MPEQRLAGKQPSPHCPRSGLSVEDIAEAETASAPTESLQRETGDEGFTLEHVLGDYGQEERLLESVCLRSAIARLPEKEQKVIYLRFFHGLTQNDCARVLGVSQVQISRLERRAVETAALHSGLKAVTRRKRAGIPSPQAEKRSAKAAHRLAETSPVPRSRAGEPAAARRILPPSRGRAGKRLNSVKSRDISPHICQ